MQTNRARSVALDDLDLVVVEPSKPIQAILRSILFAARIGRIRVFDDAEEAYHAMLSEPPHMAIVDAELGRIDGPTLVRTMRDRRAGPLVSVPVVMTAALPTRRLIERAIAAGVHFVVAKPLSPAAVVARIEAVTRDSRRFVYSETMGLHLLEDHEERLAIPRERWRSLEEGAAVFPLREPTSVEEALPAAPVEAAEASEAPRKVRAGVVLRLPMRARGFSAGRVAPPRETSTGQAANRTA